MTGAIAGVVPRGDCPLGTLQKISDGRKQLITIRPIILHKPAVGRKVFAVRQKVSA